MAVYSADGCNLITQQTTDASGFAEFLLPPDRHQLRFYKFGATIRNPQYIDVIPQVDPVIPANAFEIPVELFTPPISKDSRFCACSGFFRDPSGAPQPLLTIQLIPTFKPLIFEGAAMLTGRVSIRTDNKGFATISLVRGGIYDAIVEGLEDTVRTIYVPDAASANLPDLLFPTVREVTYGVDGDGIDLQVGPLNDRTVPYQVRLTDGRLVGIPGVLLTRIEDSSVAALMAVNDQTNELVFRGLKPGVTRLILTPVDTSIVRYPATPIPGTVVELRVS